MTDKADQYLVDAAVLGQQLINGQRHIFSAQTRFVCAVACR